MNLEPRQDDIYQDSTKLQCTRVKALISFDEREEKTSFLVMGKLNCLYKPLQTNTYTSVKERKPVC